MEPENIRLRNLHLAAMAQVMSKLDHLEPQAAWGPRNLAASMTNGLTIA